MSKTSRSTDELKRCQPTSKPTERAPAAAAVCVSTRCAPRAVSVDILLPKYKTAIFVHGCFWHRHRGCGNCTTPTNRREWWLSKLNGNAARDKLHQATLRKLGWRTLVVWECQTDKPKFLKGLGKELTGLRRTPRSTDAGAIASG